MKTSGPTEMEVRYTQDQARVDPNGHTTSFRGFIRYGYIHYGRDVVPTRTFFSRPSTGQLDGHFYSVTDNTAMTVPLRRIAS